MIVLNKFLDFFFIRLPLRFFKKNVVLNIKLTRNKTDKKVFLYYKTDPLFSKRLINSGIHSNNYEIILIIKELNRLGFSVDLVDREAKVEQIKKLLNKKYDLYIGNAAGNSAKFHTYIINNNTVLI